MGDESNDFHREVVRPKVTELLNPDPTDYILDITCGNGNYSAYLAEKAVSVLVFDYMPKYASSPKMEKCGKACKIKGKPTYKEKCKHDKNTFHLPRQYP